VGLNLEARLVRFFKVIFPTLSEAEIRTAHRDHGEMWDSVGSITSVRLAEEEFQITLDLFDLEGVNSFPASLGHLQSQKGTQ
jgi:hypothetical protein